MSTPEEIEEERARLIELSTSVREAGNAFRDRSAAQLAQFQDLLDRLREVEDSPEIRELDEIARRQDPDYRPGAGLRVVEEHVAHMARWIQSIQERVDATWLGIQESILALDETGEVPPLEGAGPSLSDLPPMPGPDDDV